MKDLIDSTVSRSYDAGVLGGVEASLMHVRHELSVASDREVKIVLTRLVEGIEKIKQLVVVKGEIDGQVITG